ncbi:MAG TPA: hypothetical protein PLD25_19840 [Chloroflexota bacterium]|nr:hypothetical protein [Chloroflexota bacterium]HUM68882.1 hypothetical protein [Chloroflexota bacterium]
MYYLPVSGLPMIEEDEAAGEIADLYEETKRTLDMPFVPNLAKAMAFSLPMARVPLALYGAFFQNISLPQTLIAMISYCIPTAKNCHYCAANGELHCRSLGIDEEILEKLAKDLDSVNPKRVRAIIKFALKCALDPQSLMAEDYDQVRDQGVSDEELLEIIMIAAVANFSDTLADALKIEVDAPIAQALALHNS